MRGGLEATGNAVTISHMGAGHVLCAPSCLALVCPEASAYERGSVRQGGMRRDGMGRGRMGLAHLLLLRAVPENLIGAPKSAGCD